MTRLDRVGEIVLALLLIAAFLSIQVLIGGTRLIFALPAYAMVALAGLLSALLIRVAKPRADRVCLWSAVLFFGYLLVRAIFSPVPYLARFDIYSIVAALVVYFLTSSIFISAKARMAVFASLLTAAMAHVFVGAIQFHNGDNFMPLPFLQRFDYGRRASGFYVCPNHLAGLLEVVGLFGLSITIWSRWPLWAKLLAAYATGICYVGLVLTASRGGYLSAAASLIVFGLLSFDILRAAGAKLFLRIGAPIFALAVLVSVATLFLVHESEYLSDRARKVIDNKNVRLDFWQASIQQWKLSPVVGTGSRTYLYYGRKFRTPEVQFDPVFVHNDYLQLLGEYGLVGLAAFVAFLFAHLRRGWLNARRLGPKRIALSHSFASNAMALNLAALSAVAAYLVHSIFDFNLHIPANALLLAFAFGILANSAAARSTMEPGSDKSSIFWRTLPWALALFLAVQIWRLGPGEYYAERARAELRDLRFLSAISYALKALDHEKENPALYYYLGRARFQAGDRQTEPEARASFYRAALSAYGEALKLAPLDETYMLELAFTYDALQRFPEAEWMYYEALAFDPKSASARRYYEVHLERWRNGGISPEPVAAEVPQSSW